MATISQAKLREIIRNAPAGVDSADVVAALQDEGHTIEEPGASAGPFVADFSQFQGPEEPGLQDPGLLDPINYAGVPAAFRAATRGAILGGAKTGGNLLARLVGVTPPSEIGAALAARRAAAPIARVATNPIVKIFAKYFARKGNPAAHELELVQDLAKAVNPSQATEAGASRVAPGEIEDLIRQVKIGTGQIAEQSGSAAAKEAERVAVRPHFRNKPARLSRAARRAARAEKNLPEASAKRAAASRRIRSIEPRARAQGPRPIEAQLGTPASLENLLRQSVQLEDAMAEQAFSPLEKELVRQQMRRAAIGGMTP